MPIQNSKFKNYTFCIDIIKQVTFISILKCPFITTTEKVMHWWKFVDSTASPWVRSLLYSRFLNALRESWQACYFVYQSTKRINVSRDSAARKQILYFRHFTLFLISSFSFHDSICVLICTVFMDPMHVSMSKLPLWWNGFERRAKHSFKNKFVKSMRLEVMNSSFYI